MDELIASVKHGEPASLIIDYMSRIGCLEKSVLRKVSSLREVIDNHPISCDIGAQLSIAKRVQIHDVEAQKSGRLLVYVEGEIQHIATFGGQVDIAVGLRGSACSRTVKKHSRDIASPCYILNNVENLRLHVRAGTELCCIRLTHISCSLPCPRLKYIKAKVAVSF